MVNVTFAFSDPSETGIDAPSTGVLKFALVNIEEASGVLRTTEQFSVELANGSAMVPLSESGVAQAWHIRATGVSGVAQWWKAVPSGSGDVNFLDLVDVDPSTFIPSDSSVPAWTAAVGQVAAVLADTETARDGAVTAQGLSEAARDAAVIARGIAEIARDGAVVAQGASEDARDQAQVYAANTVELQDTTFTALIADPESATRAQLSATIGAYLDVNVPVEVSGALASDPVVQAGVDAAIDIGLPPAIATAVGPAVTTEVGAQVPGAVASEVALKVPPEVTTEVASKVPPAVSSAVTAAGIPSLVAAQIAAQSGKVVTGSGAPNGVVTATVGTLYVDTAKTLGATIWRKDSGTGATGWAVVEGDTGWRDMRSLLVNGWTATRLSIRRLDKNLLVLGKGLNGSAATSNQVLALPLGFQTDTSQQPLQSVSGTAWMVYSTGLFIPQATAFHPNPFQHVMGSGSWPSFLPGIAG